MDIHKPKPWHGWREFLKEYGIIVLGVLTALAFEQAAEWMHWRHESETERAALYEEASENLGTVKSHMLLQPCIERRLADLDLVFQRHDQGQPLGLVSHVSFPIAFEGDNGAWSLAVSGGGLNHLPERDRLRFSTAFNGYAAWVRDILEERAIWHRLAVLDHPEALKDADWAMLRVALAEAHASSDLTAHYGPFVLREFTLGQEAKYVASPEQVFKATGLGSEFCTPLIHH